jgi:hypothetical protein
MHRAQPSAAPAKRWLWEARTLRPAPARLDPILTPLLAGYRSGSCVASSVSAALLVRLDRCLREQEEQRVAVLEMLLALLEGLYASSPMSSSRCTCAEAFLPQRNGPRGDVIARNLSLS